MRLFIIRDKRNGLYRNNKPNYNGEGWVKGWEKARKFKTKGGAVLSIGREECINPEPYKAQGGNKIILPDWIEIVPVNYKLVL